MAIQAGKSGEMTIVLRVKDDGSAVIEKFGKTAEKKGDDISTNWGKVGTAVGLAAAAAATAAAVMVKSAIDTADATGKTADKLGMTTEALSGLQYVAKLADVSAEELNTSLQMMTRNLSDAAHGGGAAKYAIQDLGLNAQQLARMKPEQAIEAIADALDKVPNANDRARISMDIFGRSGASMINVLRGGKDAIRATIAEAERFGLIISADTKKQAETFNDNLSRLKGIAGGMALTMATQMLPALVGITNAMVDTANNSGILQAAAKTLGVTLQGLTTVGIGVANTFQQSGTWIGAGAAAAVEAAKGHFSQARDIIRMASKDIEAMNAKAAASIVNVWTAAAAAPEKKKPSPGDGGGGGLGAQQIEELLKQYQDVHARMISEQQKLTETYDKDYAVLVKMLDNKKMKIEQFQQETKRLTEIYEIDLAEIQKPNPTLFDQYVTQLTNQSVALAESLMSKEQIELESYDRRLAMLDESEMRGIEIGMSYDAAREQLKAQHVKKLGEIEVAGMSAAAQAQAAVNKQRSAMWQAAWGGDVASLAGVFGEVSQLMNSSSKKQFEIGKKAALAQAVLSGTLAVVNGLATQPFFPLGIAMGAVAGAVALMNINKIRNTQFQGGASPGGAVPTFPANPGTGLPQAPGSASGSPSDALPPTPTSAAAATGPRNVNVTLKSETGLLSMEWVRDRLIPSLNEAVGDGVHLSTTT